MHMYDQNSINIRGIRHEQHKAVVGGHQGTFSMRGIIEQVDVHKQIAIIAVEGGETTANAFKSLIAVHTKNGKEKIENIKQAVGSNFTRFAVKIPASVAQGGGGSTAGVTPGTHVIVHFTRGLFRPTIQNYEILLDSGSNEDNSVIYIDNSSSKPSFRVLRGSGDINWTGNPGLAGHRFSPFSQNPEGGNVSVSSNNKYELLLKNPSKITPQLIQQVQKPSTPSGQASWVSEEQGHHAVFGDKVHILSKDVSKTSLGSNMPQAATMQKITKALAEANGMEESKVPVNITSAGPNDSYAISPLIATLANEELARFVATERKPGFLSTPGITDIIYQKQNSKNSYVTEKLKDPEFRYITSIRLAASLSSSFIEYKNILNPEVKNSLNLLLPEYSVINPLLASLVSAIRLSLLKNTYSSLIQEYLDSQELMLSTFDSALNFKATASVPNFFGFYTEESVINNSVLGNINISAYPPEIRNTFKENVSRSFQDLISYNLMLLQGSIDSNWAGTSLSLVNSVHTGDMNTNNQLPFLLTNASNEEKELTKDDQSSWIFGVWSAQARTLIQEILYCAYEFNLEVSSSKFGENLSIIKGKRNFSVVDDSGENKNLNVGYLDASFVVFVMFKLFSGVLGDSIANLFINSVKTSIDAISESNLEKIVNSVITDTTDFPTVNNVWSRSLLERTKFVVNTLTRFGMVVRN